MATTLTIEIPQLAMFEQKWAIIPATIKAELKATLLRSAIKVQGILREEAPVRTGLLRNSIDVIAITDTKAVIGTKSKYAPWVNNGTGIYGPHSARIVPTNKKVLATKINPGFGHRNASGYYIIGTSAAGQKANPFFDRAKRRAIPEVELEFGELLKTILAELS